VVRAFRADGSLRKTAKKFGVAKATVQRWVNHADGKRLDRVKFDGVPGGRVKAANRTPDEVERQVVEVRTFLQDESALGEHGADAILREMENRECPHIPSRATVNRILKRLEVQRAYRRRRYPAPPWGWYLPEVYHGNAEMDQFDFIEELTIRGGEEFHVLNVISLYGHLVNSCVVDAKTSENAVRNIIPHWREFGCPGYAQFDNGPAFFGPRHADKLGKVSRLCLSLGVTPVFAPPCRLGFQSFIESYNGRWKDALWNRFEFTDSRHVAAWSDAYVAAVREKHAQRIFDAPDRWLIPDDWKLDYQTPVRGKVIFLRETDDRACVDILGHPYEVADAGPNNFVRAELDLDADLIDFYRLSHWHPTVHPYVGSVDYHFPRLPFKE